jgi:hypothetical protein
LVKTGQADDNIDDSGERTAHPAADGSNEIELEQADEAPVQTTYDEE